MRPILLLIAVCCLTTVTKVSAQEFEATGQIRSVVSELRSTSQPKLPLRLVGTQTSEVEHFFVYSTPQARGPEERWIPVYGDIELSAFAGETVRLKGKLADRRLLAASVDGLDLSQREAGPPPTVGIYKTVAVPLTISQTSASRAAERPFGDVTPAAIRDVLFNAPDAVDRFYREASYGRFGFTGVHHPQVDVVPVAIQATIGSNCQEQIITEFTPIVRQRLLDQGIDTYNGGVDLGIIIFNDIVGCPPYPFATRGPLGVRGIPLWLWMPESWFVTGPRIMAHEIGHALGGNHPFAMSCTNFDDPQTCVVYEAADRDFMAGGGVHYFMPNNYERRRWGWHAPGAFETSGAVSAFIDLRPAIFPLGKSSVKRDQFYFRSLAAPHAGWDVYPEARQDLGVFERYPPADYDFRRGITVRIGHSNYGDPDALSILLDTTLSPGLDDAPLTADEQLAIGGTVIKCVTDYTAVRGVRIAVD